MCSLFLVYRIFRALPCFFFGFDVIDHVHLMIACMRCVNNTATYSRSERTYICWSRIAIPEERDMRPLLIELLEKVTMI